MRTTIEGVSSMVRFLCATIVLCVLIISVRGCDTNWAETGRLEMAIGVVQDDRQPAVFYQDSEGRWVFKFGEADG